MSSASLSANREDQEDNQDQINEIVFAVSDFKGLGQDQLQFDKTDRLRVLSRSTQDWWWAERNGVRGYIPANHVVGLEEAAFKGIVWQDEEYFNSYSVLKIHHEMLSDKPRTEAYKKAIETNVDYLADKVVLDVGCGTGILSMLAAKYGKVAKVYAVEASDMVQHTKVLVQHNKLTNIEVLQGEIETIELPEKVDIIISEWMGTLLLFEYMIESVLVGRDKWLKSDGLLWPSEASLFLVPCTAMQVFNKFVHFWEEQYGFDFSPLKPMAMNEFFSKPMYNHEVSPNDCLSKAETILKLDMMSVTIDELEEIHQSFAFLVTREGVFHGFSSWFKVSFNNYDSSKKEVVLNTGPLHPLTHWKQDLFVMDEPVSVRVGDEIKGSITLSRNPDWRRHVRVQFCYEIHHDEKVQVFKKCFRLWK